VLLPTINTNNINNKDIYSRRKNKNQYRLTERFINEDKNTYNPIKLNRSSDFKNKSKEGKKEFPKINSFYYNNILQEDKDQIETQSRFKETTSIKIYNGLTEKKNKNFPKMLHLYNESKSNVKTEEIRVERKAERLKSIFEKEKLIKNNNLFLGEKNNYYNKEKDILNDEMAHQIYNLKKQLLGKTKKNIK